MTTRSRPAGAEGRAGAAPPPNLDQDRSTVEIEGRTLALGNLDKVWFPEVGATKSAVLSYYVRVAPVLLGHLRDRPVTFKRAPDGMLGRPFFEKHRPRHAPEWLGSITVPAGPHSAGGDGGGRRSTTIDYPAIGTLAELVWAVNMAVLEFHVPMWRIGARGRVLRPDLLVLDLDPGEPATLVECCRVALRVEEALEADDLQGYPKTSGSKGLQIYAAWPGRRSRATLDVAHQLALDLEHELPDLVVSNMKRSLRRGKVLIDWGQNHPAKTTVAPYSTRLTPTLGISTPLTWEEVRSVAENGDPDLVRFTMDDVVDRVERLGDLFGPLLAAPPGANRAVPADPAPLSTYRKKRHPGRTPEPFPAAATPPTEDDAEPGGPRFVIQEHRARALHWDFRLEHDGVLASWALPKGLPTDPGHNHLAVPTEDHPLEYGRFEGTIPEGEYGAGTVSIWDEGDYACEKWSEREVMVVLHGRRATGRYVLFPTGDRRWMIHLMDRTPGRLIRAGEGIRTDGTGAEVAGADGSESDGAGADGPGENGSGKDRAKKRKPPKGRPIGLPRSMTPMLSTPAPTIPTGAGWAFEFKWDGVRALAFIDRGAVRLVSRNGHDITATYPELSGLGEALATHRVVLDGEIVALDEDRPSFRALQKRSQISDARRARQLALEVPATYLIFDLLHFDGSDTVPLPYDERRELLRSLGLQGPNWSTPAAFVDEPGTDVLHAAAEHRLEGVVAKRRTSPYEPGTRSPNWVKVKIFHTQEVVIGGWTPGKGHRKGGLGALLLGVPGERRGSLHYVGKVGTGFTDQDLDLLLSELRRRRRQTSPFSPAPPSSVTAGATWVSPSLVGEVRYSEWTGEGRLRHPSWRGLRADKSPEEVRPEPP